MVNFKVRSESPLSLTTSSLEPAISAHLPTLVVKPLMRWSSFYTEPTRVFPYQLNFVSLKLLLLNGRCETNKQPTQLTPIDMYLMEQGMYPKYPFLQLPSQLSSLPTTSLTHLRYEKTNNLILDSTFNQGNFIENMVSLWN